MHDDILAELADIEQRITSRSKQSPAIPELPQSRFLDKDQTRHALLTWLHHQPRSEHRLNAAITSFTLTITSGSVVLFSLFFLNSNFLVPMTANLQQIAIQAEANLTQYNRYQIQRKQLEDRLATLQLDQQKGYGQFANPDTANRHIQQIIRLFEISDIFLLQADISQQPDPELANISLHYLEIKAQLEFHQWHQLKQRIARFHPTLRLKSERLVSLAEQQSNPLLMLSARFMIPSVS